MRFSLRAATRNLPAALCLAAAVSGAPQNIAPFDTAYRRLMAPAGFRPDDFNLLINYRSEIPRTLPAVERLLRDPRSVDSLVPALRRDVGTFGGGVDVDSLWGWVGARGITIPKRSHGFSISANLQAYIKPLRRDEQAFLLREAPPLFRAQTEDTLLDPWRSERERLTGEKIADSVQTLAAKLDMDRLAWAARDIELLQSKLRFLFVGDSGYSSREAERLIRLALGGNKSIPVTIGTLGDDVHRLDRGIVFDPGGNDRYEFPDTARPGTWLLVIDLAGNDTYVAHDTVGAAAGFLSLQVIADLEGNDRYEGQDLAFGSAVMGYSRLYDAAGDDVYEARCASLGFAFHGIGILEDRSGNDTYSTAYFSQGAASTNGLGLLLDDAGNDRYISRPVYPDDLRYRDHFLSMSQGFSSGFAPRYAGGIGVLWDRVGDDTYTADIFGQGTGYWFGWGLLMDDAGNDTLRAYQYAQGAGVHFAVGTLWDKAGNDVRVSKGVSQGCGHDGGFGMLVDGQGNDSTSAVDMSAGAGSANGLGVYLDFAGNDVYSMGNPAMTLGHGDMRRDRGSFGFFLDLHGRDAYPDGGREGERAAWRAYDGKSRGYGYGLHAE